MRVTSTLIMAALGWAVAASTAFTQNAPQCVVSGSPPAGWGFNSIGYIEIASARELHVFREHYWRNIEFEHFAKSGARQPAAARRIVFCLHIGGRI